MTSVVQPIVTPIKPFPLRTITKRIKAILLEATRAEFWVLAQLVVNKGGSRDGHFYCQLVDVDDSGKQVAKMSAVIWKSDYQRIVNKLRNAGQSDPLAANSEVCVKCALRYHEVHGLQLQISDADPHWGEARIDQNRRLILERLKLDGILEKNKATVLRCPALRIGLITSVGSAAYKDFVSQLQISSYSYRIITAASAMQGEEVETQVLASLQRLVSVGVDVICLVRGGGSQIDLAWFDNEKIARAICYCPVPVWVGIGHEIDRGVLDFVAHTSLKTPSVVAEQLVSGLRELDNRLITADERLRDEVDRLMVLATKDLDTKRNGLVQGSRKHLHYHTSQAREYLYRVEASVQERFGDRQARLGQSAVQLREKARAHTNDALRRLERSYERLSDKVQQRLISTDELLRRNAEGLQKGSQKQLAAYVSRLSLAIANLQSNLERATHRKSAALQQKTAVVQSLVSHLHESKLQQLDVLGPRLTQAVFRLVQDAKDSLARSAMRFQPSRYERLLDRTARSVEERGKRVRSLSPDEVLRRGYSITRAADGTIVRSSTAVDPGVELSTELADGFVESIVRGRRNRPDE